MSADPQLKDLHKRVSAIRAMDQPHQRRTLAAYVIAAERRLGTQLANVVQLPSRRSEPVLVRPERVYGGPATELVDFGDLASLLRQAGESARQAKKRATATRSASLDLRWRVRTTR